MLPTFIRLLTKKHASVMGIDNFSQYDVFSSIKKLITVVSDYTLAVIS